MPNGEWSTTPITYVAHHINKVPLTRVCTEMQVAIIIDTIKLTGIGNSANFKSDPCCTRK